MRFTLELDGRPVLVEVAEDLASVRLGERSFPVRIVASGPTRIELEIGGETVVVEGWPETTAQPPGPVTVNGERRALVLRSEPLAGQGRPVLAGRSSSATTRAAGPSGGEARTPRAEGVPIVPPMPGRVVELKVHEGEAVGRGTVLLVLEAMKMRNEVTAPVDGVVRDLRVVQGTNVRARETMLIVAPR